MDTDTNEQQPNHTDQLPDTTVKSRPSLTDDKEELKTASGWTEIHMESADLHRQSPEEKDNSTEAEETDDHEEGSIVTAEDQYQSSSSHPATSNEHPPPPPPEKDRQDGRISPPQSPTSQDIKSTIETQPTFSRERHRSDSHATESSVGPQRSSPLSSMVFVTTALENIAASKESRRRKALHDSVQKALALVRQQNAPPNPEAIFEPLRLATETSSIPLTTTALDCVGKLISYSYFSLPIVSNDDLSSPEQLRPPLIERAIDTICDCFQDEATPAEIQLQIVKSLLAAVLNDKIIVHGAGLLKAVRQIYNIFLLSKSTANQQVAQGTLVQMVGTVFERVKTRLSMKESRWNMAKFASERGTANGSQVELDGSHSGVDSSEIDGVIEPDVSSEAASVLTSDQSIRKEPGEKLTLQSFENAKNFDDTRIGDNAPTMVTRVRAHNKSSRLFSGQSTLASGYDDRSGHDLTDEDEEDEIYVKDAFLVFRSMCRLSTKTLPQDQLQDLKSQNMRSKLVSLAILRTTLNNNMDVFISPLVTIRSSTNNEPTSFGQAINQYLRLSLSRNGASAVRPVFECCCEIFWLMLKDMRVMLKVSLHSKLLSLLC